MVSVKSLFWPDRLALMEHYGVSETDACRIFDVDPEQLKVAKRMQGTVPPTKFLDYEAYAGLFGRKVEKTAPVSIKRPVDDSVGPQTASRPTRPPKKRGRQGSKIANAFAAIPREPIAVSSFISTHGVSEAVIRQARRFDKNPELGSVRVKKDKDTRELMIWRDDE